MKKEKQKRITIIIADDHPLFRSGVRAELEQIPHFDVLAESGDGEESYRLIRTLNPDIAILDFQMPKMNGLDITRKLEEVHSRTHVVLLTMHSDRKIFYAALDAGVCGYVLKDDAVADIVRAVNVAAGGEHFISSGLTDMLVEKAKSGAMDRGIDNVRDDLTSIEKKIINLIACLKSNEEIAEELFISKRTVENHKGVIADKLGLSSSKHLLRYALQNKSNLEPDARLRSSSEL
jgi:DNA-binding NarL/FixJ family response regulator